MEILRGVTFHQKKSAVSLGKFDGIHLGHQLLMNEIKKQEDLVPTVFTFEGMKTEPESLLYSEAEKQYLLEQMGIEREILFPFNDQTKIMSPESFIQNMLWDSLDARLICVGEDYRFGCKRAGDVAMLERACKKHGLTTTQRTGAPLTGSKGINIAFVGLAVTGLAAIASKIKRKKNK